MILPGFCRRTRVAKAFPRMPGALPFRQSFTPMPLVVVGSVAIDNVETPIERRDNLLGGSATHFSFAASFFTGVRLVGVVGADWPPEHTKLLNDRGIDTSGLQVVPGGKTFTWTGTLPPEHERPRHARHAAQRLRRVRPACCPKSTAARSTCSSPTACPRCR